MRALIALLTVLFTVAVLGVTVMNASETVTLRLWWDDPQREYHDVPVGALLLGAAFAGFVFTGIVAVLEGMKTRLDNARLNRKVRRLQQELDAIRTPALSLPSDEELEGEEPGRGEEGEIAGSNEPAAG